jgi:hypothetical protein
MLKPLVNFATMLIGTEGARLLENAIAFSSCGEYSWKLIQCPAGKAGQGRPRRRVKRRGGSRTARGKRAPGAQINMQV